jgi:hypothetical protein
MKTPLAVIYSKTGLQTNLTERSWKDSKCFVDLELFSKHLNVS